VILHRLPAWHGGSGQKVGVGSMQLSSPPVMNFNSFLFSFLPILASEFFIFLIFNELAMTNVIKINEHISLYIDKVMNYINEMPAN